MNRKLYGKSGIILFAAAIFLSAFKCCGDDRDNDGTRVAGVFGGSGNVAIIANPDSVKAWRTLGSVEVEQWDRGKNVDFKYEDYYVKTGKPIVVSTNLAAQLSRLLLDKNTYPEPTGMSKQCLPDPPVVVTFSKGDKSVDVFLCFGCKILIVNKMQNQSDFDPGAEAILKVIKKIFPKDRKIRSISIAE